MLIKTKNHLPLMEAFSACFDHFPESLKKGRIEILSEIQAFMVNRAKTIFIDYGFAKDEIEAALSMGCNDVYEAFCKVEALHQFRAGNTQFPLLFEVYKRAKGQLNAHRYEGFSHDLLKENAEKILVQKLEEIQKPFDLALENRDYSRAYQLVAEIQPGLAALFDQVKILDDDPKLQANRLGLLQKIFDLFGKLLDFSKIQL